MVQPGGYLLHAFKVGTDTYHLTNAYGHDLDLDVYCYDPADVITLLVDAGFTEVATLTHAQLTERETTPGVRRTPQAVSMVPRG